MLMVSVDPGATGTGVAVWKGSTLHRHFTLRSSRKDWFEKCRDIVDLFKLEIFRYKPDYTVLEMPAYMHGVGGHMVATSGDLIKLTLLTGMMYECANRYSLRTELVPVAKWKGQLPKRVCEVRIRKLIKLPVRISNHAVDAIGIGLWALGKF